MEPLNPTDERELLLRLRAGDYAAFDQLYQSYRKLIFYKFNKMVQIPEIVEELHQDVFMKAWEHREKIKEDIPFRIFLLHMAKNIAINFYHKAARDKTIRDQLMQTSTELYTPIDELVAFNESNEALASAIAKLPP